MPAHDQELVNICLKALPRLQREDAAGKQEELDRVQRAYEHIKAQEQKLESQLSHISEEVKGTGCAQGLPLHCLLCILLAKA